MSVSVSFPPAGKTTKTRSIRSQPSIVNPMLEVELFWKVEFVLGIDNSRFVFSLARWHLAIPPPIVYNDAIVAN